MRYSTIFPTFFVASALVAAAPTFDRQGQWPVERAVAGSSSTQQRVPLTTLTTSTTTKVVKVTKTTGTSTKTSTVTSTKKTKTVKTTSSTTKTKTKTQTSALTSSSAASPAAPTTTSSSIWSSSTTPSTTPASTSTTQSSSPAPSATSSSSSGKPINAIYYPDWTGDQIPPENVNYAVYDVIYFSFAIPAKDYSLYFTQSNSADLLKRLIKSAHAAGSKVCITIGGWTGSQYFSGAVATASRRTTFANNIVNMVNTYGADGVDIDWEYPNQQGNAGNEISKSDSANLLEFLKLLRSQMGSDKVISLATPLNVWIGSDGNPLSDVSTYAPYIDHVLLMNYDVWGASSTPGPNAPYTVCSNAQQPGANAVAAIAAWIGAGMPANQIVLGVPSYGYVSNSQATTLINKRGKRASLYDMDQIRKRAYEARQQMRTGNQMPRLNTSSKTPGTLHVRDFAARAATPSTTVTVSTTVTAPQAAATTLYVVGDGTATTSSDKVFSTGSSVKAVVAGDLSGYVGQATEFLQLVQAGVLQLGSDGKFAAANGYTRAWDSCSQTPYLYNVAKSIVVTYDDPDSLYIKAAYALSQGLKGVGMWDIAGDTASWNLAYSVRAGLGLD